MDRKFPFKLFVIGVLINFFLRYPLLFLLGAILCLIGIGNRFCLYLGLAAWGLDLILSIYSQLEIRKAVLSESDSPEFNEIMDAYVGEDGFHAVTQVVAEKTQNGTAYCFDDEEAAQRTAFLEKLVVYRTLRDSVRDGMTLEELIDTFAQMCTISVGDPDDLLFETGTFRLEDEKFFLFSLVRQFRFFSDDEFVQLHMDVIYAPTPKTALLRQIKWEKPTDSFFQSAKRSFAFRAVQNQPIVRVDICIEET